MAGNSFILYRTTNIVNKKYYYGVHHQPVCQYQFDGYFGSGTILNRATNKHGEANFKRETLRTGSRWLMYFYERRDLGDKWKLNECYNIKPGGFGGWEHLRGLKQTKQHIEKRVLAGHQGKKRSKKSKERMSISGKIKKFSEDHRNNMSVSRIGLKHSPETKKKISISQTGIKNHQYGKKHSTETRKKISEAVRKHHNLRRSDENRYGQSWPL